MLYLALNLLCRYVQIIIFTITHHIHAVSYGYISGFGNCYPWKFRIIMLKLPISNKRENSFLCNVPFTELAHVTLYKNLLFHLIHFEFDIS